MEYNDKVIEGVRRLRQLSSITDTRADLKSAAMTSKKRGGVSKPLWQYPKTFDMEQSGGYWIRSVIPRMGKSVEKGGFAHAVAKIVGTFDGSGVGNKKGNAKTQHMDIGESDEVRIEGNSVGASVEKVKRMYPAGKRNTSQARSSDMSNTQLCKSGIPICWDFVSHGGRTRGAKCANSHGNMTPKNIHWAVKCELAHR